MIDYDSYLVEIDISRTHTSSKISPARTSDPFSFSAVTSLGIHAINWITVIIFPVHWIDWPKDFFIIH